MASCSTQWVCDDNDDDDFDDNFWPPLARQHCKFAGDDEDPCVDGADDDLSGEDLGRPKRKAAAAASAASHETPNLSPMKIREVVWTARQMPTVSTAEMKRAVKHHKTGGVTLQRFNDPEDPEEAGRVLMHFGEAVKNPIFQLDCPTLCALYHAYQAASKSFCLMITWRDALWLHCDLRALLDGVRYNKGSISDYIKAKLAGSGPDESIVLVGHQIAGATELVYAIVEECWNKELTFRRPKKDPRTVSDEMKESIVRAAGELTEAPTWLHAGRATATPGPDGLDVSKISFDNRDKGRLMHAASGKGEGGFAISILASVWKPRKAALYTDLGRIRQFQDATRCDEDEDESTGSSFFAKDGPFRRTAAELDKASPSGTGGLTAEEQKQACCGDQPVKFIGLVRKNRDDGSYFRVPPKEHGQDCLRGQEESGNFGKLAHAVLEPSKAKKNCDALDTLTGLDGWVSRNRNEGKEGGASYEYSHSSGLKSLKDSGRSDGGARKWMNYTKAAEVGGLYAATEGKKQKQPKLSASSLGAAASSSGSSSAPIELD